MLQRAASNAYSWWWASHIRTKQSKWMEQNLQDMEEKVQNTLKLLQEEGDSFAKRAEMYYKRRPELINFVEESFRAYRSLADRYDHISTELQNANNTIASVCPDQVPYMDDDDDEASPRPPRKMPEGVKPNVPKVPKPPLKDLKSVITTATKKLNSKKVATTAPPASKVPKSGLSRKQAIEEVDKLQKQILALQTVKEFLKSSYDNAIARYWDTEEQIKELQEKVSNLQDELGEGVVIDDEEARRLMAETALKSCQEALSQLQEKQATSLDETKIESKRVKEVRAKLSSLMDKLHYDQTNPQEPRPKRDIKEVVGTKDLGEDVEMTQQRQELQLLQEKIKEHFEAGSGSALTVTEMAEKIDELVNKVISLETAVSSQTALVKRLKVETDELHSLVRTLECDKESLIGDKVKLNEQLREMDEKLHGLQDLNQIVEDQNSNLQTHFTEAHCNLDHISEKVQTVKPDEEAEVREISPTKKKSSREAESKYDLEGQDALDQDNDNVLLNDLKSDKELKATALVEDAVNSDKELKATGSLENEVRVTGSIKMEEETPVENKSHLELKEKEKTQDTSDSNIIKSTDAGNQEVSQHQASKKAESSVSGDDNNNNQNLFPPGEKSSVKHQEIDSKQMTSETKTTVKGDSQDQATSQEDESDWRQSLMQEQQEREKALLLEYNKSLQNYEEVKSKLAEVEKKSQDALFESSLQLKELKTANAMKDEEIRLLRQKLSLLQESLEANEGMGELASVQPPEKHDDIEAVLKIEEPESTSAIEEKFRMSIDELLEENLEFWLQFSTSFTEIQKFETTTKDLLIEVSKLEEKWKSSEGSSSTKYSLKSDARPLYKHLAEIQNELTLWLENSAMLKEELQRRFSSLCEIQEEITTALKTSAEDDDFKFTSYQAAKFQGEILNMKQENNKVADQLQAGLDLVTTLQLDAEKALAKLNERFGLSNSKRGELRHSESRNRVPLRSFIFGVKPKKQNKSIFSCMTPAMHRKYRASRG